MSHHFVYVFKMARSHIVCHTATASLMMLIVSRSLVIGQCVYSTMTGYIYQYGIINETHVIKDYNVDCEILCYNSLSCLGANVRKLENGTILCEFRLVNWLISSLITSSNNYNKFILIHYLFCLVVTK